jgi:diguanylate cyclase (GGDEF)-like protein/PAS domain S-box-containing protein
MKVDYDSLSPDMSCHRTIEALGGPELLGGAMMDADLRKAVHELQVHQIELALQNEELRRAQAALEASRELYVELYDLAPVGYCTFTGQGLIRQANLTMGDLLGVAREELSGQSIHGFVLEEDRDTFSRHTGQVIATGEPQSCDVRMVRKDGTTFWAHLRSVIAREEDGKHSCRTAFSDITESRLVEEALRNQKELYLQIAENLSDFIAVLDLEGRRLYNSPSYERFFGAPGGLRDTDSFAEVHPDDKERVKQVFSETVRTGIGKQIEYRFVLADGSIRDMESRGSLIRDEDGRAARVLVVARDVTERNELQERVRKMAFHDDLTGLPNRRLFSDRFNQALATRIRSAGYGALMFIDLDGFKPLNDAHGHDVGDLLLIEAATRLKRCVREMDTVARFGGDEFVVMLSQLDLNEADSISYARRVAEKLRATVSEPYVLRAGHDGSAETAVTHRCTASIGVTLFGDRDANSSEILKRADSAMYLAKQAGGNQLRFWDAAGRSAAER